MTEKQRRIVFTRIANRAFGDSLNDSNRRAYWDQVLEPIWRRLNRSWGSPNYFLYCSPQAAWDSAVRSALRYAASPEGWRPSKSASPRKRRREDAANGELVNTRAFWQGQSFGAASSVVSIDPSSYKIED
jgi:hypothetical protein